MDKKKVLILGSTLIVTGLAVYLFLKNKKSKGQTEAKNESIIKAELGQSQLVEAQAQYEAQALSEAKSLSELIAKELIAKSKVKRASSKAGADMAVAKYTEQMAKLGYKPLVNGGVQKI